MEKKIDAAVAGHICLDIIPIIEHNMAHDIKSVFVPGRLINLNGVEMSGGGAVANTGGAMSKLGLNVLPMASTGDDEFGHILVETVKKQSGIEIAPQKGKRTSYSVILAVGGNDRIILHDPAGNESFCECDIDFGLVKDSKLFHLGYPPLLKRMYEGGGSELISIFKRAKKAGAATSLDMSLPDTDSESGRVEWSGILKSALPDVDIFLPSVEEAFFIFDREEYTRIKNLSQGDDFTKHIDLGKVKDLGKKLIQMGCAIVVIKCGAKGLYVKTAETARLKKVGGGDFYSISDWANAELFEEAYKVRGFKSALAAGDTAIAGFLSGFIRGFGPADCVKIAAKTGALCCTAYDALSGVMSLEETRAHIEKYPEKMSYSELNHFFEFNADCGTWFSSKTLKKA